MLTRTLTNAADYLLEGKDPTRCALQFLRQTHTYGDVDTGSKQSATALLAKGARKGDRVLLIGDNSMFWVAAYLGTLRAGLVCVPLATSMAAGDLEHVIKQTDTRIAFAQADFAARNATALRELDVITDADASFAAQDAEGVDGRPSVVTHEDDLAALMFTSGSTGKPHGVMISHRNIIANTESIIEYLQLTAADRIMAVLPFHYCFGTSLLHTHLRVGGSLVVDSRFLYPEIVLQRMIETECTGFAGVPSHFQILLRKSSLRKKRFPHLRYVQQAGGALAPAFVEELRLALPQTKVFVMYGQTEATARLSYLPPELLDTKPGSIGAGIPGVKLRVLNEQGEDVRPGEVGEIVAEGANVAKGYWREEDESAKTFRNGTLYTGDLAKVDEDGFVFVVDRAKDFLKCCGQRVSCRILEEQLLAFGEIVEAAVIGIPDDVLGEAVRAFVVSGQRDAYGLEDRLLLFCKSRLAPHHVPKEVVVLPALPKSSSGKVLKPALRAYQPSRREIGNPPEAPPTTGQSRA